jgi:hypothetical protein
MRSVVKRERVQVLGIIDPQKLYDTDAVMHATGIGEVTLREERKAGRLKAYKGHGGRNWYRGQDLIALIVCDER